MTIKKLSELVKIDEIEYRTSKSGLKPEYHVPSLKHISKIDAIKKYCLIDTVKDYEFCIKDKIHRDAHHLNSSQMTCYNFFRPFKEDKEKLSLLLNEIGIIHKSIVVADFEYEDNIDKFDGVDGQTNFDFFAGNDNDKIYFEIKYTEANFGGCENDEKHNKKYELYKPLLEFALKEYNVIKDDFFNNYQLFRNISRINNIELNHSLIVIPADRDDLKEAFNKWHDKYVKDDVDCRVVTWEDLISAAKKIGMERHAMEFEKRYFNYK